jgi:hypothetical protein
MSRWLLPIALVPVALFGAETFEGAWKIDLGKAVSGSVNKIELNNGMYSCSSCVPAVNIKADGADQKATGTTLTYSAVYDTMSVKVVDAQNVEIAEKRAGKTVEAVKYTVSADGNNRTGRFTIYHENSSKPGTVEITGVRVEKAPDGAHALSGGWREKVGAVDIGPAFTLKAVPDGWSDTDSTGGYTAKFDGQDYPGKEFGLNMMVSLKRFDANTFDETFKFSSGQVLIVNHISITPDGKTMNVTSENKLQGTTIKFAAVKE